VGINKNGNVFFAISEKDVTFYEFSAFFKEQLKELMVSKDIKENLLDDDTMADYLSDLVNSCEINKFSYKELHTLFISNWMIQQEAMSTGKYNITESAERLVEIDYAPKLFDYKIK
jgi:uncharacterized protein YigE (DUF2233 family)